MTRTIETTTAEDEAIAYAYKQSQKGASITPPAPTPTSETEAEFFERMVHNSTISPMTFSHTQAKNNELVASLSTIPEANRPAAKTDIEAVIVEHGGTVSVSELTYQWSTNTAAPPRVNSIEADKNDANLPTITKLTFDDLDAGGVSRMSSLLALKLNTLVRLEDQANAANFLQVTLTATPIQRQGADGYVELPVAFHSRGGSFAALDTKPLKCTFV